MKLREIFEAGGVMLAKWVIPLLPRIVVYKFSRVAGGCVYLFMPRLRNVAAANIELVFGDSKSDAEKRRINIASLQSFALTTLDLFWFNRNTRERFKKYVKLDESFRVAFDDPSALFLSAHFGNWEILAVGCGIENYPLTSIAMPLRNPFADRELNALRQKTGSLVATRKGALRTVLKALKQGRGTAMLIDQNTLPEEGGVFVPFFGLPVPVANVAGTLQSVANSKIFVTGAFSDKRGHYTAYSKKAFVPSDDMTREDVTVHVTRELESVIYENPDYWLWSYKRWCFYRKSDDRDKFPFYAESYEEYAEYRELVKKYRAAQVAADDAHDVLMEFEGEDA